MKDFPTRQTIILAISILLLIAIPAASAQYDDTSVTFLRGGRTIQVGNSLGDTNVNVITSRGGASSVSIGTYRQPGGLSVTTQNNGATRSVQVGSYNTYTQPSPVTVTTQNNGVTRSVHVGTTSLPGGAVVTFTNGPSGVIVQATRTGSTPSGVTIGATRGSNGATAQSQGGQTPGVSVTSRTASSSLGTRQVTFGATPSSHAVIVRTESSYPSPPSSSTPTPQPIETSTGVPAGPAPISAPSTSHGARSVHVSTSRGNAAISTSTGGVSVSNTRIASQGGRTVSVTTSDQGASVSTNRKGIQVSANQGGITVSTNTGGVSVTTPRATPSPRARSTNPKVTGLLAQMKAQARGARR